MANGQGKCNGHSERWEEAIYPNFIMDISGKFYSLFYEGPGAVGWKEAENHYSANIERYNYDAPRPDIMIYSGIVDNIYDANEKPFRVRKNPFMVIECKEDANWYKKIRKKYRKKEIEIVKDYGQIYAPEKIFVVSLEETPEKACNELEENGIICINIVGFDKERLKEISMQLA